MYRPSPRRAHEKRPAFKSMVEGRRRYRATFDSGGSSVFMDHVFIEHISSRSEPSGATELRDDALEAFKAGKSVIASVRAKRARRPR